jgi:hypothetical protein
MTDTTDPKREGPYFDRALADAAMPQERFEKTRRERSPRLRPKICGAMRLSEREADPHQAAR